MRAMDSLAMPTEIRPPAPPAGYQQFAWCGIVLVVPREWNLCRYEGNGRRGGQGGLVFADLRAPRLFVRLAAAGAVFIPPAPG